MAVVTTRHEFESSARQMAAVAAMLWPGITALGRGQPAPLGRPCFPVAFLATTRPDGSPRLHPFCPVLTAGRLLTAIPRSSPKGNDLRRDPGCAIHALPGPEDDELSIRARARESGDNPSLRAAALAVVTGSGVGGMIETVSNDPISTSISSGSTLPDGSTLAGRAPTRSARPGGPDSPHARRTAPRDAFKGPGQSRDARSDRRLQRWR